MPVAMKQEQQNLVWMEAGTVDDFPEDGGLAVKIEGRQIAVYNFRAQGRWFACDNTCPHKKENVLARGLLGDAGGVPKVACPMHKKTFALESGECLSDPEFRIATYGVRIDGERVFIGMPG